MEGNTINHTKQQFHRKNWQRI